MIFSCSQHVRMCSRCVISFPSGSLRWRKCCRLVFIFNGGYSDGFGGSLVPSPNIEKWVKGWGRGYSVEVTALVGASVNCRHNSIFSCTCLSTSLTVSVGVCDSSWHCCMRDY